MGHLKDITNQPKTQTFPSSTFEIAGEVPASQCSEAAVEGDHGITDGIIPQITDVGRFAGWALAGKTIHITSPAPNAGSFLILGNTDDVVIFLPLSPLASNDNVYYVTNGGALILTRNIQSFAAFISAAGYSYTIKGGKLYTNIPTVQLQNACTILFDPLT